MTVAPEAPAATSPAETPVTVLVGLQEIMALLPQVANFTVYRWNTVRHGHKQLPEPYLTLSGTPLWTLDQIREFASSKGLVLDYNTRRRIASQQERAARKLYS